MQDEIGEALETSLGIFWETMNHRQEFYLKWLTGTEVSIAAFY
jgi:hypothetical protein